MKSQSIRPVKDTAAFQPTTINNKSGKQNNKPALFMRWILMLLMFCTTGAYAQFAVTTNGGSGLAGTYGSLAAAITALNGATITAPVVITCPTGTETAPLSGYSITATGTVTNTITIQGNGAANSIITAFTPQTVGSKSDAIIKIIGGDYITIQGFKMQENTANVAASALATNNETEFGVALFAASTTNGAQNNTIQNNTITLSNPTVSYQNAIGIFSTSSSSSTNGAQAAASIAGTNSNNKYYSNIISGVAQGLYFISPTQTATVFESGNDIGGTSGATGNTITFGISNTAGDLGFTSYSGTTAAGIYFRNVVGNSARFNTITSVATLTLAPGGIFSASGSAPTGVTYTSNFSDNNITITYVGTALMSAIDFGSGLSTGTIIGNNNTIILNQNPTAAISTKVVGIMAGYAAATNTCSSNNITINMTQSVGATTSNTFGIDQSAAATTITANSNTITFNESTSGIGTVGGAPIVGLNPTGAATTINVLTNTILINQTTSVASGIGNALTGIKAAAAATTLNITTNNSITIKQAVTGSGSYGSGAITFINASAAHGTANITGNNLNTTGSTIRSTGALIGVFQDATVTTLVNVKSNSMIVDRVATSGSIIFQSTSGTPSEVADTLSNNIITFTSLAGTTSATAISSLGGPSTPAAGNKSICNNTINISGTHSGTSIGITCDFTNTGKFNGNSINISSAASTVTGLTTSSTAATVTGNTVALSSTTTSPTAMTGIAISSTTGTHNVNNNSITSLNFSGVGTTGPSVFGISYSGVSTPLVNMTGNAISGISVGAAGSTGSATVAAINAAGGIMNIVKNTICSVSTLFNGATTQVSGVRLSSTAGSTALINNRIGDLNASAAVSTDAIRGINVTSTTASTNLALSYNTVYLNATTTATTFGSTALFVTTSTTATTVALTSRNNIFVNNSAFAGAGLTVAYRRSSGAAGALANYASASDRNLLYAGTPGASNLIYSDGTGSAQTITAYKGGVFTAGTIAPRDANSITENPPFLSTTCGNANFLKINTAVATGAESGGANLPGITDDFEGDTRNASTPDIGADEFAGTPLPNCTGTPASATINGSATVCAGTGTTLSLSTIYTDLGITYQWRSATVSGGPYSTTLGTSATQPTGNLSTTTYYIAEITCTFSGLTFTTAEKSVIVNALPTVAVTPTSATYCTPGGTAVTLNGSGAVSYTWAPTTGLTPTTGATVAASPSVATTYTVTGTDANGCVNTATAAIAVANAVTISSTTATPSTICSGATSTLNVNATIANSAYSVAAIGSPALLTPGASPTTTLSLTASFPVNTNGTQGDDSYSPAVTIPFTFGYNGSNITQFWVSTNGYITFSDPSAIGASAQRTPQTLPSTTTPNNVVAIFWHDMDMRTAGNVRYYTIGSAPNREMVIEFNAIPTFGTSSLHTGQIVLYEAQGTIDIVVSASPSATKTLGIENSGGTVGVAGTARNNAAWTVSSIEGWKFTFPSATYSWAPSGDVVSPTSQSTLTNALSSTETFTVTATSGGCSATGTATVTISAGAAITTDPVASAKCAGQTATFTVVATGPGLTYQWRKGGVNIPIGGNASAGTATLSLSNVTAADVATYDVVVTATCGLPVTSLGAALTVTTPLAGINASATTICSGQSVTLTENGGNATSWSWNPGGATTQAITVSPGNTTTYTVTATVNTCSTTATQTITVNPSPTAVTVTPAIASICAGASTGLTASGGLVQSSSTLTLGTGTSSSTATSTTVSLAPNPLQSYYGGAKQQMIVLASELTTLGFSAGPISSIAFNLSAVEARNLLSFQVKMGHTALAAFSSTSFITTGLTVVRNAATIIPVSGWNTITFNTNFVWNGTSNIVIETNFSNNDGGGTGTSTALYSTTAFASTLFFRVDTNTPAVVDATTTATFSAISQRNNMQINGTTLVAGTYNWLPNDGSLNAQTGANVTATPASTTTYTATVTSAGCSASNTSTVTVNPNYTITASAGANGSISPNGVTTLTCNGTGNQTYTIAPNTCYSVADVLVDGVSVGAVTTYSFTNVTANHTISASFVLNTFTITVTAGANGSVTPATGSVNCGSNATYTITANACYSIANVIVDGVSQGAVGTYTFTNVTAAHTISASFSLNTYTITVSAGTGGSITPGTGSVNCGDNATYTISPDACHTIADVVVDGVSQGAVGTYTFTNVTAAHTISASFNAIPYTITVTAGANGSITPSTGSVNCGSNATYTITANACYSIANVVVDGVSQGAVGTYTFTNVTAAHTISATFVLNTYTITVTAGANGSVTPVTGSVNCGDNATYTITPNACYSIANVIVDGVSQGAVGTYTFTNVTAAHTISATFVLNTYTITVTAGANGAVTPVTGSVNCGDNATYTITPNACYSIADVVVDGVSQGAVGTYTFTNVTAAHTISATFVLNTYTITVTAGIHGAVTPATGSVNCGANATYTITPDACYTIADVVVDGVSQGAVGTYTFTNVTAAHTISATFTETNYTITVTAGANGSITPATGTVTCGANATYTITANACYSIADVVVDGVSQGAVGTYTFTNVTANHTISATFVLNTYTITVTAGANGSITPATGSVNCGANATYTITPNACYSIADVVVDGVSQGAVGTYTFTNVTAAHTISATFVLNTYTITVTAGANGSITPATGSVNCGANATYTITPNACYSIADVVVDGVSQGAIGTYTFTNVTAAHTISATFALNTYTITVTAGANGSITPATGSVNCGDNATYTITPNACYQVADVVIDGVSQGSSNTYTFTNVTANHTISATFAVINYSIGVTFGPHGSITPGTGNHACGSNVTYTITPDPCYSIEEVDIDGIAQPTPVGTYTFTNISASHSISASFVLNTYIITATAGANGSITPATGPVNCGDNATYTITPNACYSIADVVVDGVSQGAVGTYTFTNVTAAHTISATFVLNTYTITVTAGANGSITPATGSVNCGANATYTITPNACYSIADVVVDGVSQGAVGTYTFTNVTAAHTISATFVLNTYTITVTAGANGSITPATGSVNCGANATYTITPNACYSIADVVVDGVSQGAIGTYTFTNVTAAHTISATFALSTYTITVTAGANGSVTPATGFVNCGDNATYTITPDACYVINQVIVDGVSAGTIGTYTFTNVTANHTISATFVLATYTITVTNGANGSVNPQSIVKSCGSSQTFTMTPDACYSVQDVVVDGVSQGAVGTYTFTNITANHSISATFVLNTYAITVTSGANGSVTPATGSVNCGANATYTITPNACYSIADVVVDGVSQGAIGTYTFTNVTAAHTISATFVLNTYTITVTAGANGSITPATGSVNCGANATYTITPNACYAIADVVVDGVSQGAVGTYTFTNVTAAHTISATFALTTYTITVTAGANGSITPATGTVNCGANATYTITPNACYSIADVVVDGVSQGAVGTYTFTNVTANHTISATFVLNTYTITVTAGANGSITPATGSVNCGANATYTITPNACYSIADVVVDGVSQGAIGTYTFTNVTAAHTISATFVLNTYTITVTAGANGSITPATGTVNCGANATYTITPNACYSIADVVVDGVSQGAVGTYTFTNVTAAHTISATFALTTYTITVTAGANGSITPATGSVNCGANATYTITANACYSIANVIVDGVSQGAVGTYTFTNVTANHTISATFVLNTYTITVTAGANGSITPATGSVNCGANATYTITANGGYAVQDVIVDGVSQGPIGTYTFTNVTANHAISATFVVSGGGTFTITSSAGANGSISPNGATVVNSGANQTYTITPVACYHVNDVLVDGVSVGAVTTYTFTNVTANHTISAGFAANTLTVSVSGPINVCPYIGTGTQVTYTATAAGATGFTWVIPPTNVTIISGQGTANLTVTFQNGFAGQANKQLRVTALSPCGNSPIFVYYLAVQIPSTPQPIVGTTSVCSVIGTAGTLSYTIPSVPGASSYNWVSQQPANTTITHPNGLGVNDTTVNISFGAGFTSSSITVSASNQGCGTSGVRSLALTKTNPSQPGLISGPTNACAYMAPGGTVATYSIVAVAGATSYTWTVPAGAIGVTPQGTTSISFTYPNSFVSGTVSVTATNGCGTSVARSLSITKLTPSTPSVIDVIQVASCPDRIYTYTLSAMPSNATSVQWTVPAGGTITSGQGTSGITVSYTGVSINGNVTAQGISNCGSSTIRISVVKLGACGGGKATITSKGTTIPATATPAESMQVNVFPNPTVSDFKLQVVTAAKQTINVRIMDAQGRNIKTFVVMPYQTINIGSDLKAGAYIMEVRQGNEVKTTKLLKF